LTRHFDQQFEDTEIIGADIIGRMKINEMASPEEFKARMSSDEAHRMLNAKVSVLSYVGDVLIFDADGKLINSSGIWPVPSVIISDRPYFQKFRSNPHCASVMIEPLLSMIDRAWTTVIAHRLDGPNGEFLGVMARRIDAASYEKFFASVVLGPSAAISMFHSDGTVLA